MSDLEGVVRSLREAQPNLSAQDAERLAATIVGGGSAQGSADRGPIEGRPVAGLTARGMAAAVDAGVLGVLYLVVFGLLEIAFHEQLPFPAAVVLPAVAALYLALTWGVVGCTPGMYSAGLPRRRGRRTASGGRHQ